MTSPYYEDDLVTLYHGDALAVLADMPSASVDALITDPPYSSGGFTRADRTLDVHTKYVGSDQNRNGTGGAALGAFGSDNRDQRGMAYWCTLWLGECLRIVKPGGAAVLFTDWRQLPLVTDVLQAGGFVWRGIVPWYKPTARPQAGRFTAQCEYAVWGTAGARPIDYSEPPLPGFYQASPPRERDHITQKPLDVMRSLVKIAPEGGVILDPFMGAGTTGVAAILERRLFVGSELTEHFADVSRRRIVEAAQGAAASRGDQPSMFGEVA